MSTAFAIRRYTGYAVLFLTAVFLCGYEVGLTLRPAPEPLTIVIERDPMNVGVYPLPPPIQRAARRRR